jgi:uncharacterized protein YecE (DUF72 family)
VIRIGTAGWTIPPAHAALFPGEGPHLARYAARFNAAEINSSFHRPHRPATYARWAATVPDGFQFAVKLPKTITHTARLIDTEPLLHAFADQIAALADRQGPILIQLPPKLAFDPALAARFLDSASAILPAPLVCEPRHPSWFEPAANLLLTTHQVARVAADPARVAEAARPGGAPALVYFRLHGSPHVYTSPYGPERLQPWRHAVQQAAAAETWCIFDNTARGEAALDALTLSQSLQHPPYPQVSPPRGCPAP